MVLVGAFSVDIYIRGAWVTVTGRGAITVHKQYHVPPEHVYVYPYREGCLCLRDIYVSAIYKSNSTLAG